MNHSALTTGIQPISLADYQTFKIGYVQHIQDVPHILFQQQQPFLKQAFWQALHDSNAIGTGSDWPAFYLIVYDDQQQPLGAMPVFAKQHNRGEYVFDFAWAEAYKRYGRAYYPRLVTSVPFTPVTGARTWLAPKVDFATLWPAFWQGILALQKQLGASSWHGLFLDNLTLKTLTDDNSAPLAIRLNCQYLWENQHNGQLFNDFDGFLATLTAKRRKSIKLERAKVAAQGLHCVQKCGPLLTLQDWQVFYQCYAMTYLIRGRKPYLTLDFFIHLGQQMPEQLMLVQAIDQVGQKVAAALFFYDDNTLYGRYWGALIEADSLHFEACYYQGIEFALARGLQYFDPGTQGEHKLIRGFAPVLTHSAHWVAEGDFQEAIQHFCETEAIEILNYQQAAIEALPFKQLV